MGDRYDFSKGKRNPYAKRLKKQITIRLDEETPDYFKEEVLPNLVDSAVGVLT